MDAKLTKELTAALCAVGEKGLEVVDAQTQRTYLVVDAAIHRQAMEALRRQQQDTQAIAQGIVEMEAGEGIPIELARHLTRERLLAREP